MFSLFAAIFFTFVTHAAPTPFTQLGTDTDASTVSFLDDSKIFVQTWDHSGVWDTSAKQVVNFGPTEDYAGGRVVCGYIAVGSYWKIKPVGVHLYDRNTFQLIKTLQPPTAPKDMLWSHNFNADCSRMIISLWPEGDGPLRFVYMDVATGTVLQTFDLGNNYGYMKEGILNAQGTQVLVYHERAAGIYNLNNRKLTHLYYNPYDEFVPRFSPDGRYVIVVSKTGSVDRYDIEKNEWKNLVRVFSWLDTVIGFHPTDPTKFFIFNKEAMEVDINQGVVRKFGSGLGNGDVSFICANNDSVMFAQTGVSQIFDLKTGALKSSLEHDGTAHTVFSCSLSSDGQHAVIATNQGARLYSIDQARKGTK